MRIVLNMEGAAVLLSILLAAPLPARAQESSGPRLAVEQVQETPAEAAAVEHGKAFTGDASPVDPGRVEVELAYAPTWWATAGSVDRQAGEQHPVAAAVGVGLFRDVDARLVLGWAMVHATPGVPGAPVHGEGLTDTTLAVRWRFLSLEEPRIDLAVSAAVTMPTGVQATPDQLGTSRGTWSAGGALLASADWGRFTAGAELGFSTPLGAPDGNDVGLLVCNAALGYQVLPWLQPEVELNYQHEVETGPERDERVLWATAALVVPVDAVRLMVGARLPIWRDTAAGPMVTAAIKYAF